MHFTTLKKLRICLLLENWSNTE